MSRVVTLADFQPAPRFDGLPWTEARIEGTDITEAAGPNEKQKITITGAEGGTFTLTFDGEGTADIAFNATKETVEEKLEALSTVGVGNVTVTGDVGGPYTIEFVGDFATQDVAELVADGSELEAEEEAEAAVTVETSVVAWSALETFELDPLDEDPTDPALRGFTVASDKEWLRVVFLDADENEDEPSAPFATSGAPFRPTIEQVSATLRARTYTDAEEGVVGGDLAEAFNADTRPTAEQIEGELIPDACTDVIRSVGRIPGFLLGDARRVAALGVCREIERSYLPEQAEPDGTTFQTLRLTVDEETAKLRRTLQWAVVSQHLESAS